MATGTLVSVEQYLNTTYRPDCDYVDGEVLERNVGEKDHSELQTELVIYLGSLRKQYGIHVFVEQRVQILPTRFRVPDVCIVLGRRPSTAILREPPFLGVEILSKDDGFVEMEGRINDYLQFGVPNIWVIDPRTRKARIYNASGSEEVRNGILTTSDAVITVSLSELY